MKKPIEELGLHLTVLLYKAGADDQAYAEIIASLKQAKERAQTAPQKPPAETSGHRRKANVKRKRSLIRGTG